MTSWRQLLAAIAGDAGMIGEILDALRAGPLAGILDVDTAAALRVELDQAAAAAADLRHTLRNTILTNCDGRV